MGGNYIPHLMVHLKQLSKLELLELLKKLGFQMLPFLPCGGCLIRNSSVIATDPVSLLISMDRYERDRIVCFCIYPSIAHSSSHVFPSFTNKEFVLVRAFDFCKMLPVTSVYVLSFG